ncbi:MAG: hypothetical protein JXA82_01910 [Sedimentisphaerales bacterium]|nr:hypothetical protein [Sedimentisphaerales bacterium]
MKRDSIRFPHLVFMTIVALKMLIVSAFAIHADFNDDNIVNLSDFARFAMAWGTTEGDPEYDVACDFVYDGEIDLPDGMSYISHWLEPEEFGEIPPIPYGGKFRRVDIHGIPMPDRSPTGEGEDDRLPNMAYVDMFSLTPDYSVTDVAVPVEGQELTLEFRRTCGIRNFRHSTVTSKKGITYPSDFILGLGWDTNLSHRAIVSYNSSDPSPNPPQIINVTDDTGTSYSYLDDNEIGKSNPFDPDVYHSFTNQAIRATCYRVDSDTLVLVKTFGTRLTYKKIGRFCPPGSSPNWEDYYRLDNIEDRNGNKLEYIYDSDLPTEQMSFLVSEIREAAHPERKLSFSYTLGGGSNGDDWGSRLNTVTDPLGQQTTYSFGASDGKPWDLLLQVTREAVPDGENSGTPTQPVVSFIYYTAELTPEETSVPPNVTDKDPETRNRFVGPKTITDARGNVTTFNYTEDFFVSTICIHHVVYYQKRIRLTGASTVDGSIVLGQTERTAERVATSVQDTRGNTVEYEFLADKVPVANRIGLAIYITQLTRTSTALASNNTAVFQWSSDPYANLIHVTDMSGNSIDYEYGTAISQKSNQPTKRTMTDTTSNNSIDTTYAYSSDFGKMTRMVDNYGKQTLYTLDSNGNRTEIHEELSKTTLFEYAADGFMTRMVDPDGRETILTQSFNPADLNRYYTVISTVKGYSNELELDTEKVYDVMGMEVEMTDPKENVSTYEYDGLYRRIRITNPAVEASPHGPLVTSTTEYTYTLNGSVVEEKDDNGNVTVTMYDLMNRPIEIRRRMTNPAFNDSADLITMNTYNPVGLVETGTDPEGNIMAYAYDALLRPVTLTFDVNGPAYEETYQYDDNAGPGAFMYMFGWKPTRVINRRGYAKDTKYDGFYRPIQIVQRDSDGTGIAHDAPPGADEPATMMSYNNANNITLRTTLAEADAGGERSTYTFYDDLHRPTVTVLDFDGDGNDGSPYDPNMTFVNNATVFGGHDTEDFITRTVYDMAGNVIQKVDANGNATDTTYDGAMRVIKVEKPAVAGGRPTMDIVYDDNGNKILLTDANGNQTQNVYDARNRLIRTIADLNGDSAFDPSRSGPDIVTDTHYDMTSNVVQTEDPKGNATDKTYDFAYQMLTMTGPAVADTENSGSMTRPVTSYEYDKNGNVIQITDPRGVNTVNTYDGLNRILSITKASGTAEAVTTTISYDRNNNITSIALDNDPYGIQTTSYGYDPYDRRTSETWPGSNQTLTEYYRDGLAKNVTDPKSQTTLFYYDRVNRLITRTYPGETQNFTYDRMENILTVTDLNGTSTYSYDACYRRLTETRSSTGQGTYIVTSAYDLNGNRTSCTYPQTGRTLSSNYDRLDRVIQITDSNDLQVTGYEYDKNGNIINRFLPNDMLDTFSYDALNRVIDHTIIADPEFPGGDSDIYSAEYEYDLVGNRRGITETVQGQPMRNLVYDYDDQYRLTGESWVANSYTYTYDRAGNRLTKTYNGTTTNYTYNARNELLTEVTGGITTSYSYDLNGNCTRKTLPTTHTDYFWDAHNRLTRADVDEVTVFEATYDYRTRRLTKTENSTITYFRYDGGVSFQEVIGGLTPAIQVEFIRGSGMGGGIGSILYSDRSSTAGAIEFFCFNAVGHTVALTDPNSTVVKTDLYDAFGNIVSSTRTSLNNRLANTKERDASIGLDNHGFRYYDSGLGRYIQRDPAGYVDGLNVFLHVNNNPINHIDPLGLKDENEEKYRKQAEERQISLNEVKKARNERDYWDAKTEMLRNYIKRNELLQDKYAVERGKIQRQFVSRFPQNSPGGPTVIGTLIEFGKIIVDEFVPVFVAPDMVNVVLDLENFTQENKSLSEQDKTLEERGAVLRIQHQKAEERLKAANKMYDESSNKYEMAQARYRKINREYRGADKTEWSSSMPWAERTLKERLLHEAWNANPEPTGKYSKEQFEKLLNYNIDIEVDIACLEEDKK